MAATWLLQTCCMRQGGLVVFVRCNTGEGVDEIVAHVLAAREEALAASRSG
jgi:hypothetical protein